LQYVTCSASW